MPLILVQSNSAIAGVAHFPGSINLPCAFPNPVGQGNLLFAYVSATAATRPSSLSDTLTNDWEEMSQPFNVGDNYSCWAVQNSNPGTDTVTANGMTVTTSGGPNIIIAEFEQIDCFKCGVGIQAFNPPRFNSGFTSAFTKMYSRYNSRQMSFFHTLLFALYDDADAGAHSQKTWSFAATLSGQTGQIINSTAEDGGNNTSVLAMSTIAYPAIYNECQLTYSPSTPTLHGDETYPFGVLINSQT